MYTKWYSGKSLTSSHISSVSFPTALSILANRMYYSSSSFFYISVINKLHTLPYPMAFHSPLRPFHISRQCLYSGPSLALILSHVFSLHRTPLSGFTTIYVIGVTLKTIRLITVFYCYKNAPLNNNLVHMSLCTCRGMLVGVNFQEEELLDQKI